MRLLLARRQPTRGAIRFRILGRVAVDHDGRTLHPAGARQRAFLALLLLARGRPVSTDRLIEGIWSGPPPETALETVQVYVSQLRRQLGAGRLIDRGEGYQLVVAPGELDADRFDELVRAASGAPPEPAAARLRKALALFQGEPLADLSLEPWAQAEIERLEERRLDARRRLLELEQRILRQDPAPEAPLGPARGGRARGPRRTLLLAGAVIALAAAVAAAAAVVTAGGNALAALPPGVAIVDVASGRLVAHIPWRRLRQPATAITGDGSFWVWSLDGYSLVRIDPDDGSILGRINSPSGVHTKGSLVEGRSLWFSGKQLFRMDIARGAVADRYSLTKDADGDGLADVARGGGSLWVTRHLSGEVLRVDPVSGRVQKRIRALPTAYSVAYGDGGAWVVMFDGVARIDAATNTVARVNLPAPVASVAVGGGYAWVSNEARGAVYKVDRSGIVATYETGDGARDLSYADGTLWVANQDVGTVTGIDTATGAERTFRFGHPLASVAALHGKLLVELWQGRPYDERIDALKGRVARLVTPTYEFDHPDPAISGNGFAHSFMFQAERATCAPLLGYPDAPPPRGQHLVPEVAAAMPVLSSDAPTYTFTVRRGFRFAPPSNAPLRAETFRYSVERALSPRLGPRAPGAGFLGDLDGVPAFRAGRAAHVAGIRVRGQRISFTLTRPSPDFLERLALPYFCPVPLGTPLQKGGVGVYTGPAPPGAGPYSFSGPVWNGEYAILKRNPNYGGSRPQRLDAIAFREGIDTGLAVGRVEQGRFDAIEHYDPLLAPGGKVARRFRATAPGDVAYRAFSQRLTHYIALDAGRAPFDDPALRRRVAAALPRASLAALWSDTPTELLLPPTVRGVGPPRLTTPGGRGLRRPSRGGLVRVHMAVPSGNDRARRFAEIVHAALSPLGLDVRAETVGDVAAALRKPGTDIVMAALSTSLDYPDPASFLARMLGLNVPRAWLPSSTATAVTRLARLSGPARDRAAVALAARVATRDVPVVAFGTPALGTLVGPRLGCRVSNGAGPGLDLAALCLAGS